MQFVSWSVIGVLVAFGAATRAYAEYGGIAASGIHGASAGGGRPGFVAGGVTNDLNAVNGPCNPNRAGGSGGGFGGLGSPDAGINPLAGLGGIATPPSSGGGGGANPGSQSQSQTPASPIIAQKCNTCHGRTRSAISSPAAAVARIDNAANPMPPGGGLSETEKSQLKEAFGVRGATPAILR